MLCELCRERTVEASEGFSCDACALRLQTDQQYADQVSRALMKNARHLNAAPSTSSMQKTSRCDVLVIDDDLGVRQGIVDVLGGTGLSVLTANDGKDGLRLARHTRPKLIVLDMMMPVMNGWEFLTALSADPELVGTSVVQASAYVYDTTPPAVARLRKPFEYAELLKLVDTYVPRAEEVT